MVSVGLPLPEVGMKQPSVTNRLSKSQARQFGSSTESSLVGAEPRAAEDVVGDPRERVLARVDAAEPFDRIVALAAVAAEGQHVAAAPRDACPSGSGRAGASP